MNRRTVADIDRPVATPDSGTIDTAYNAQA